MYCSNCGAELPDGASACAQCGAMVGATLGFAEAPAAEGLPQTASAFPGQRPGSYEYARTAVASDLATVATDCYESLGFELTGTKESPVTGTTALAFRRSRKVRARAQLSKLQRTMDDLLDSIASLEAAKTRKARTQAIVLGTVSALVLDIGMCCTMVWTDFFAIGVVVGLVGIGGCLGTFAVCRKTAASETARINPRIESAYDQLAAACEEAQAVLRDPVAG